MFEKDTRSQKFETKIRAIRTLRKEKSWKQARARNGKGVQGETMDIRTRGWTKG